MRSESCSKILFLRISNFSFDHYQSFCCDELKVMMRIDYLKECISGSSILLYHLFEDIKFLNKII